MKDILSIPDQIVWDFLDLPPLWEKDKEKVRAAWFSWLNSVYKWMYNQASDAIFLEDIRYLFLKACRQFKAFCGSGICDYYLKKLGGIYYV